MSVLIISWSISCEIIIIIYPYDVYGPFCYFGSRRRESSNHCLGQYVLVFWEGREIFGRNGGLMVPFNAMYLDSCIRLAIMAEALRNLFHRSRCPEPFLLKFSKYRFLQQTWYGKWMSLFSWLSWYFFFVDETFRFFKIRDSKSCSPLQKKQEFRLT